jgi:hypothetical protein
LLSQQVTNTLYTDDYTCGGQYCQWMMKSLLADGKTLSLSEVDDTGVHTVSQLDSCAQLVAFSPLGFFNAPMLWHLGSCEGWRAGANVWHLLLCARDSDVVSEQKCIGHKSMSNGQ